MKRQRKDHKTRTTWRKVADNICMNPRCKYFKQRAVQGHCFSKEDDPTRRYVHAALAHGEGFLSEAKKLRTANKQHSLSAWVRYLEGHVACQWANVQFTVDALIHLRHENAKLRKALGNWK